MLELAEQGSYVVLAGDFNPAIFNPDWLAAQGLVSGDEVKGSHVEQISPQIAQFEVGSLTFDIRPDRLMILAEMEPFVRLADLVGALFLDKLRHTPLRALGINYYVHAIMPTVESRIKFGRLLAPIEPWGELKDVFDTENIEDTGGMVDLTMQTKRQNGPPGIVRTTVQPSNKVPGHLGVFVQVNDHFADEDKTPPKPVNRTERRRVAKMTRSGRDAQSSTPATNLNYAQLCVDEFSQSLARSKKIIGSLLDTAEHV